MKTADPATQAWKAIVELVGWGSKTAPRFPMIALALDLSPKQLGVLWRLEPGGTGTPMRSIAESLYCDASYVTDLVDRLEERGLIVRGADPGDRRVKLLQLTPEGEELRKEALDRLYAPPEGIKNLSAEEQRTLAGLLDPRQRARARAARGLRGQEVWVPRTLGTRPGALDGARGAPQAPARGASAVRELSGVRVSSALARVA